MDVNFNHREPIYLQVIRYFKEQIASGGLQAGQVIPSRRELADLLKINPNTAQRCYKEMEAEGLIFTEGNSPSRITTDESILSSIRTELISGAVDTFIAAIHNINVELDELIHIVTDRYAMDRGHMKGEDRND